MKEFMKKIYYLCILVLVILFLGGCTNPIGTNRQYTEDGKIIVRISMINSSSYPLWRAQVESRCPGIRIKWENNRNTVTNVLYQAHHGDMPQIIAIRRFESDTTTQLQPYLADLSSLSLTSTYKPEYLKPFAAEGKQYWLPAPGVFDGIVANVDLFQQYGLSLPRDRDSFIRACAVFQQQGIKPVVMDCKSPWTPIQLMEAVVYPEIFSDPARLAWWQSFAEGKAREIPEDIFNTAADTLRMFQQNGILPKEALQWDVAYADTMLVNGQTAMIRKSSDEMFYVSQSNHYAALPFFGKTSDDSWLYTYPIFSVALSKDADKDPAMRQACEKVLTAMLDEEAQQVLNKTGMGLISYNKDIQLPLSGAMHSVQPLIERERCFIRILDSHTFQAASLALTALLRDYADNEQGRYILNWYLFKPPTTMDIGVSQIFARNTLDEGGYSPSASIIAKTLQAQTGTDCAIIDIREALTPIYQGKYTDQDVNAVVDPSEVYKGTLTGAELSVLLNDVLLYATTFAPGSIEPIIEYPALSGLTVSMKKDGTILKIRQGTGGRLQAESSYTIAISGRIYGALVQQNNNLARAFTASGQNLKQYFTEYFQLNKQLPEPSSYFIIKESDDKR